MKTVITIAREFGSGGAEVGRMIASRLGFYYADRLVLSLAAKRLGLAEVQLSAREERIKSFWDDIRDVFAMGPAEGGYTPPPLDPVSDQEIFAQEGRIMSILAERHDCVVIGRGGRFVFKDHPNALHVLLHAPMEFRVARVMRIYAAPTEEKARRMIDDYDRARAAFRAKMTKEDPYKASNYHICLDTSQLALPQVAELILAYHRARSAARATAD
jgi:cytidylate kinase